MTVKWNGNRDLDVITKSIKIVSFSVIVTMIMTDLTDGKGLNFINEPSSQLSLHTFIMFVGLLNNRPYCTCFYGNPTNRSTENLVSSPTLIVFRLGIDLRKVIEHDQSL